MYCQNGTKINVALVLLNFCFKHLSKLHCFHFVPWLEDSVYPLTSCSKGATLFISSIHMKLILLIKNKKNHQL